MIYSFKDYTPVVHESSFVHPLAAVTGNVIIGKNCYEDLILKIREYCED